MYYAAYLHISNIISIHSIPLPWVGGWVDYKFNQGKEVEERRNEDK